MSAFKMEHCPLSPWNGVRDDGGTLPAISMECCPPSRGIRTSSFNEWLLIKNGLGIEAVHVFPVFDERDPRKTWNSIVREQEGAQSYWADVFEGEGLRFDDLLAFAEFGTGDYYCFDYSAPTESSEYLIVRVSHETGERRPRARTFAEFAAKAASGDVEND